MRKNFLTILALIAVFALALTGCGGKEPAETTAAAAVTTEAAVSLGLSEWSLSTTTWSSPNGATVNLTAAPNGYAEGDSAAFIVRLEGEDVVSVPCDWDGTNYTAAAELNAADGYCYYVAMTGADGSTTEVAVNIPSEPFDETLINLETSLSSYCSIVVESSAFADGKLTLSQGTVAVEAPKITNNGEEITVSEAVLVLSFNGADVATEKLTLDQSEAVGSYEAELSEISFDIPEMENDQQLVLTLKVTLSNGQSLTAAGGNFFYNEGELLTTVG